jgi:fucose 4-O-acetylase-like acetyltransferase
MTTAMAAAGAEPVPEAPAAPAARDKTRLLDIDRAKGLGIALVVWGHMFKHGTYDQPVWLDVSRMVAYEFHMPFFMYLSGFVFFYTGAQERFWKEPARYVAKRFDRLMVPFLAFALLVVLGKYVAASLGSVDDGVADLGSGLMKVVANTPDNPSLSIWYLLVLFLYSIVTPLLWRAGRRHIAVLLLLGAVAWALPLSELFYVRRIGIYFLFFAVGGLFALRREAILPIVAKLWLPAAVLLGVLCYLLFGTPWALLFCGLAAIPALHGLFLQRFWDGDRVLLTVGRYSMAIYLLNTIFIGIAKVAYGKVLSYQGGWYALFVAVVFGAGLVGPMLVRLALDAIAPLRPVAKYLE